MVLTQISLNSHTQNAVYQLANGDEEASQARGILKRSIMISIKKVRLLEQIWFIKMCIRKELVTTRISKTVERLNLRERQREKLQKTMMTNIKNELHKEFAEVCRKVNENNVLVNNVLTEEGTLLYNRVLAKEQNHEKTKARKYFRSRIKSMGEQKEKRENEETPDEIDGIRMDEQELDERFTAKTHVYGGVQLSKEEEEALKLPPKFSMFEKPDILLFKANIEKTFNRIRWNKVFESVETTNEGENVSTEFFDAETNTFDGQNLASCDLPFNKRVHIPEYADKETEAQFTLCRSR